MFQYIGAKTKQRVGMIGRVKYAQEEEAMVFIVLLVSQQAQCLTLQVDRANQTHSNIVTSWLPDHSKN